MHSTIGILVYAHTAQQAEAARDRTMKLLSCKACEKPYISWKPQEEYIFRGERTVQFRTEPAGTPVAGEIIEELMDLMKVEFFRELDEVRMFLAIRTNQEIFDGNLGGAARDGRYSMWRAGAYEGSYISLYTEDAEGIRDRAMLKNVLGKWPELYTPVKMKALGDVWLCLVEVHDD